VLLQRLEHHQPGVVDDHIQPPPALQHQLHGSGDLLLLPDVAGLCQCVEYTIVAQLLHSRLGLVGVEVGNQHARAFLAQAPCHGQADATGGASDDGDLVLEAHVQPPCKLCGSVGVRAKPAEASARWRAAQECA
jgi:hypothetical protein